MSLPLTATATDKQVANHVPSSFVCVGGGDKVANNAFAFIIKLRKEII